MDKSKRKLEHTSKEMEMKTQLLKFVGCGKTVLRGKFTVIQNYLKKQETNKQKSQTTNLTRYLKESGRKRTTDNAQSQQKETENNKYR